MIKCNCGYESEKGEVLIDQGTYDVAEVTGLDSRGEFLYEIVSEGSCDPFPPIKCPECFNELEPKSFTK